MEGGKTSTHETAWLYDGAHRLEQAEASSVSRAPDGTETRSRWVERYVYDADGDLSARRSLHPETGETTFEWRYEGTCY